MFKQCDQPPVVKNSGQLQCHSMERDSVIVKEVWIRMLSVSNPKEFCFNVNVVGPVYKVDEIVGGISARAFIDSSSQVCIVRKKLLPYIKEKQNWPEST